MKIAGLSNQWETRQGLYDSFAGRRGEEVASRIRQLFDALEGSDGPDVFIGTSHSSMNFSNRDVVRPNDRTRPFAHVDVIRSSEDPRELCYRVRTREIQKKRPTTTWITREVQDPARAADIILDALPYADVPVRRATRPVGG